MLIDSPGPVGMRPAFDRVTYERGRDSASIPSRLAMIKLARLDIPTRPLNYESQDKLVCHYLCLAAAYMVAGSGYEANEALVSAQSELKELESMLATFFRGMVVERPRLLRAVLQYNASVLYFETDNSAQGRQFLSYARATLDGVSNPSDRSGEMYSSLDTVVGALEEIVRRSDAL